MKIISATLLTMAFLFPALSSVNGHSTEKSADFSINPLSVAQGFSSLDSTTFFGTGRLRSEDQLRFQRPPADVPPVRSTSQSWQFIIFKEGGFSFWVPPGILNQDIVNLKTAVGEVNFRTLTTHADDRRYVVAYANALTPDQVQSAPKLLDAIRDRVAPADQFKRTGDRAITINQYPGRELSFVGKTESITFRAYLVGNKAYVLGVIYPNTSPKTRATRAFLNAFELL